MSAPVEVLKLIPAGVALIAKLAIAPPVELMVNPVAAVLTVRVSEAEERVKAGAAVTATGAGVTGAGVTGAGTGAGSVSTMRFEVTGGHGCAVKVTVNRLFVVTSNCVFAVIARSVNDATPCTAAAVVVPETLPGPVPAVIETSPL